MAGGGAGILSFTQSPPSDDVQHMINDPHPSPPPPPPPPESIIYFVNDPLPSWADHFYFVP